MTSTAEVFSSYALPHDNRSPQSPLEKVKRPYKHLELEERRRLIFLVERRGKSIRSSAKLLGIKYSTAKTVVSNYKTTGHVETLLTRKRKAIYQQLSNVKRLAQNQRASDAGSIEHDKALALYDSVQKTPTPPVLGGSAIEYCTCSKFDYVQKDSKTALLTCTPELNQLVQVNYFNKQPNPGNAPSQDPHYVLDSNSLLFSRGRPTTTLFVIPTTKADPFDPCYSTHLH